MIMCMPNNQIKPVIENLRSNGGVQHAILIFSFGLTLKR